MLRKTSNTEILVEHALKYRGDKQWVDYANPWKSCLGTFRFLHFWTQGFEFCLDESWWDGQTSKPTVLWCFDSELLWWLSRKWHRLARVLRVATRICTVLLRFGCWHSVRMRWTDCSIYIYIYDFIDFCQPMTRFWQVLMEMLKTYINRILQGFGFDLCLLLEAGTSQSELWELPDLWSWDDWWMFLFAFRITFHSIIKVLMLC